MPYEIRFPPPHRRPPVLPPRPPSDRPSLPHSLLTSLLRSFGPHTNPHNSNPFMRLPPKRCTPPGWGGTHKFAPPTRSRTSSHPSTASFTREQRRATSLLRALVTRPFFRIPFLFTSFADPSTYLLSFHIFPQNTRGWGSPCHFYPTPASASLDSLVPRSTSTFDVQPLSDHSLLTSSPNETPSLPLPSHPCTQYPVSAPSIGTVKSHHGGVCA